MSTLNYMGVCVYVGGWVGGGRVISLSNYTQQQRLGCIDYLYSTQS